MYIGWWMDDDLHYGGANVNVAEKLQVVEKKEKQNFSLQFMMDKTEWQKLLLKYHLPLWLFIGVAFGWSVPAVGTAWSGVITKNEYS